MAPDLTVQEALDILFGQDDDNSTPEADTLFIAPPDPVLLSDEDSGDEDTGGTTDNLNARQLTAQAEIRYNDDRDDRVEFEAIPTKTPRTWYSGHFEGNLDRFPDNFNYNKYKDFSLVELFELFIDDEIIDLLVSESNRYALTKVAENPNITGDEIRCFIAILLLSGYNSLPNKRLYWDSQDDTRNILVVNSMRRNRFEQILRFLHCQDNTLLDQNNKMWKLQPLISKIKGNLLKHFVPEQNLSYDESMVKYYGKHSCKQFIRNKPIRFGYKIWCLCNSEGYLLNFQIYQGKNVNSNTEYQKIFGKSTAPLLEMIDDFPPETKKLPFHFFFDNLFTSLNLLSFLRENQYGGTGTMRSNRLSKSFPLQSQKDFEKTDRGTYESVISKEDGVIIVRWRDNSAVTVASNCLSVKPVSNVRRFSQSEKKFIQVPRPKLVGEYNRSMGGVDRLDQNIANYRIQIRNKKWYWSILTWLLDAATQNAWLIARHTDHKITQLDFRREIVQVYLKRYGCTGRGGGRPAAKIGTSKLSEALRYDGREHLIQKLVKKRRCAGDGCKAKKSAVRTQCGKCDVGLCVDCFENFHKK